MNLFTGAGVYVQNQLFATLDATARTFTVDDAEFILIDTVGFLQDLPHHLIDAFRSTLESAVQCDLALIVCDASADHEQQLKTTLDTLQSLDFHSPYLIVMNKCDLAADKSLFPKDSVAISAKTGEGIDLLKEKISACFAEQFLHTSLFVPYALSSEYNRIRKYLTERKAEYTDEGEKIDVVIPAEHYAKFKKFLVKDM
jgi:GTP-binding protein HflX